MSLLAISVSAHRISGKRPASAEKEGRLELRRFDKDEINAYREQKTFQYDSAVPAQESFLDKLFRLFWELIERLYPGKGMAGAIKYVFWGALIGALIYFIIKVSGLDLKMFAGAPENLSVPYAESADNIHEINFEEEIQRAAGAGKYRVAVRLCYLFSLKKLDERQLIKWKLDKTNQVYLSEIEDAEKRRLFGMLTREFEYIWYGGFGIGREAFNVLKGNFDQFNRQI